MRIELKHLISKNGGGTFKNLTDVLYYTRLFKYVHKSHYRMINNLFYKVTADWKLQELCDSGYLFSPQEDVYCATDKSFPFLKEAGYKFPLPEKPKGTGDINELNNTETLIKIMLEKKAEKTFLTFLYPDFGYLIPDALLVELKERQYRLTFIEVEAPKPDWQRYIISKERNYLRLAKDYQFYEVWSQYCDELNLPKPNLDVKFNYRIIKND